MGRADSNRDEGRDEGVPSSSSGGVERVPTDKRIRVLLLRRTARGGSSQQTSRVMDNEQEIADMLSSLTSEAALQGQGQGQGQGDGSYSLAAVKIEVVLQDLSALPFEEQVRLVASASILVGVHGAGIASSMHMAVGTKYCCGVVEVFPPGEFMPIHGYGNMARRMGHHYQRLPLGSSSMRPKGVHVPPELLRRTVIEVLRLVLLKPSCILPAVLADPHLNSVPSPWNPTAA